MIILIDKLNFGGLTMNKNSSFKNMLKIFKKKNKDKVKVIVKK